MRRNLLEYLEYTAGRLPDKIAFASDEGSITFGKILDRSRRIGTALINMGCRNEPVVVLMNKHPNTPSAYYGVMYSGCYYVPLDRELGEHRVKTILEAVQAKAVICDDAGAEFAAGIGFADTIVRYDAMILTEPCGEKLDAVRAGAVDIDPAYMVYTSGSTGVPKGVVAKHSSVMNYIEKLGELLGIDETTSFGNQAPLYVDTCQKELYSTIRYGATAFFIPKSLFSFPVKLIEYLNDNKINTICWVASALAIVSGLGALKSAVPQYVRTVTFGGETLAPKQLRAWRAALPNACFFNLYGPSEVTGASAYYEVTRDFADDEIIPIGKPFPNSCIILHEGEIYLRGTGVTAGYFRDFARTAESFVQNPKHNNYPDIVYRTGDLARYDENGDIVFTSRRDHQIKHQGYRIELLEIEAAAVLCEGIGHCCCVYDKTKSRIILHYTGSADFEYIREFLKSRLPPYMLPHRFTAHEALPMTPSGKVDRVALLNG